MASGYHDGGGYGPDPGYAAGAADYGGYGPDPGYGVSPEQYDYEQAPYSQDVQNLPPRDFDQDNKSYQQYTESRGATNAIDAENGIAPRRFTDCVVLVIFCVYMLGMFVLVIYARESVVNERPWSEVRRLTHGHDYKGRLCGVDAGVENAPFLYWCRMDPVEWGPTPSKLNLEFPSCVPECPMNNGSQIGCLFPQTVQQMSVSGGPFGTVETYHVQFQQSVALTNPYDSVPYGGRFCVPKNVTMKEQILHEPLRWARLFYAVGSLEDPWVVIFQATLISIAVGYAYLFIIKIVPKLFVFISLYVTWIMCTIMGIFLLIPSAGLLAQMAGYEAVLEWRIVEWSTGMNPFYEQYTPRGAAGWSCLIAAICWCVGCCALGTITHVSDPTGSRYLPDLVDAAAECFTAMPSMLIPPGVEGIVKFLLTYVLAYNFLFLFSLGTYEERRLIVNGRLFKDETAVFHTDWGWLAFAIPYYIFGWVWLMELATSCGQFLVSFSVISWYFMKKEGPHKTGVPSMPTVQGALAGVVYHAGSVCLGAAIIPWVRVIRLINFLEDESLPDEDAACCPPDCSGGFCSAMNCVCAAVGKCGGCWTGFRKSWCTPSCCNPSPEPRTDGCCNAGCAYRYSKNAYNDVIIRSQHFLEASQRSFLLIYKFDSVRRTILEKDGCKVLTFVGSVSIGLLGGVWTHWSIMTTPALTDPTSGTFIAEPIAATATAFFLCMNIAYGFMMLFDHTADTLLYCYAWNKKFARENKGADVEDYLPESLRDLVDVDQDEDDGYDYYGQAKPEMYLSTWLGTSRRRQMKDERLTGKERQSQMAMGSAPASSGGTSLSQPGAAPGYANLSSQVPYQQVASSPGALPVGGPYYDPSSPGGYGGY